MDADEFKIIKRMTVFYPNVVERHRFDADPKFGPSLKLYKSWKIEMPVKHCFMNRSRPLCTLQIGVDF